MIYPTLCENSRFFYKIPDFKTWKQDQNKFPTFSRFFNTVGALKRATYKAAAGHVHTPVGLHTIPLGLQPAPSTLTDLSSSAHNKMYVSSVKTWQVNELMKDFKLFKKGLKGPSRIMKCPPHQVIVTNQMKRYHRLMELQHACHAVCWLHSVVNIYLFSSC